MIDDLALRVVKLKGDASLVESRLFIESDVRRQIPAVLKLSAAGCARLMPPQARLRVGFQRDSAVSNVESSAN